MKRRRSRGSNLKLEVIPEHIIMEILSRLPVRDIYTCLRVCKTWRSLLSHPHFPKLHEKSKPIAYLGLTNKPHDLETSQDFFLMEFSNSSPTENKIKIVNLKFRTPFEIKAKHMMVSNHCHGFFCLYDRYNWKHSYVCNPVLNEYVPIPHNSRDGFLIGRIIIGFDPVSNTYKLLRFRIQHMNILAEVLVLGGGTDNADPWSRITNNKGDNNISLFSFCKNRCGLAGPFLNGNFHQVMCTGAHGFLYFDYICTFDFTSHQFKILPPPLDFDEESGDYSGHNQTIAKTKTTTRKRLIKIKDMTILTLDDFLCIGLVLPQKPLFQVWAMKEYGVRESWTKYLAIETRMCSRPIALYRNGELLLTWQEFDSLASCVKQKEMQNSHFFCTEIEVVPRNNLTSLFGEVPYSPSFVSLKYVAGRYYENVESGRRVRILKDRPKAQEANYSELERGRRVGILKDRRPNPRHRKQDILY